MISDLLDILLAVVCIIALICFFILCSNISAIRKILAEYKSNQDKKIDDIKNELEKVNRSLNRIDKNHE